MESKSSLLLLITHFLLMINWQNFVESEFRSNSTDLNKIWDLDSENCPKFVHNKLENCLPSQMKNVSQQLISSDVKRRKRGCSRRQKNPPILNYGKKGGEADTSHHRFNFLLNNWLGARIFIYFIFSKSKGTPTTTSADVDLFLFSKQTPILLFQCILF